MKRFTLWWGDRPVAMNFHDIFSLLEEIDDRRKNVPDAKWLVGDDEIIAWTIANSGILLIGTTPARNSEYYGTIPARGYQIIWGYEGV